MKLQTVACLVVASVLLATAAPSSAKSVKYTSKQIGAEKTCRNDDAVMPVAKCMKKFGEQFCKDKGHKTYIAVNWSSSVKGYSDPTSIYCK
jgi:hypothetical protein